MVIVSVVHAEGPPRADRALCGFGYVDAPMLAAPGLVVNCPDCKEIIAHCQDRFTANYRVRASQGEEA